MGKRELNCLWARVKWQIKYNALPENPRVSAAQFAEIRSLMLETLCSG